MNPLTVICGLGTIGIFAGIAYRAPPAFRYILGYVTVLTILIMLHS